MSDIMNRLCEAEAEMERLLMQQRLLLQSLGERDAEIERLCQLLRDAGVPEWVINNE